MAGFCPLWNGSEEDPSGVTTLESLTTGNKALSVPWGMTFLFDASDRLIEDRSDYRRVFLEMENLASEVAKTTGVVLIYVPFRDEDLTESWDSWLSWGKSLLFVGAAFVPVVAQALDAQCVANPELTAFERWICLVSLELDGAMFASALATGGVGPAMATLTPNPGAMFKALRGFKAARVIKMITRNGDVVEKEYHAILKEFRGIHTGLKDGNYLRSLIPKGCSIWELCDFPKHGIRGKIVEDIFIAERHADDINLNLISHNAETYDAIAIRSNEAIDIKSHLLDISDDAGAILWIKGDIRNLERRLKSGQMHPAAVGKSPALEVVVPDNALNRSFIEEKGPELMEFARAKGIRLEIIPFN